MITYIKKDVNNTYVTLEKELSSKYYNNIGETYEDYLNNKWVRLTDELIIFHETYPTASIEEVFDLQLRDTNNRTIELAKKEILRMVDLYDKSTSVNGFIINDTIDAWFTPQERNNYKNSIDAAKLLEVDILSFYVKDILLNTTPENAEKMLALILLYADQCFIVTQQHKINISGLLTIEEVDNYDYTKGYPEKLKFNL